MKIKKLLNNKGARAVLIIFAGIIIVAGVSSCRKHIKNKNKAEETDNMMSDAPVDFSEVQTIPLDNMLSSLPTGALDTSQPNTDITAPSLTVPETDEPAESSLKESSTESTKVDYSFDRNEFEKNIEGDFKYSVRDGYAVIDSYLGSGGAVKVPMSIGGYSVKVIGGSAFAGLGGGSGQQITSVVIASGTERIESKAFSSCVNLTSITIPNSVTFIGEFAFEGCPKLVIRCSESSYARTFASENNMEYTN